MRSKLILLGLTAPLLGGLLAACATAPVDPEMARCGGDYRCLSDLSFRYRQDASDLTALAQRYEQEATVLAREKGQDSEQVVRNRELAKQLWSQAQTAEQKANDYRQALPHNQLY